MRKTRGFISDLEQCVYYLEPPIFYANILYFRLFILSLHSRGAEVPDTSSMLLSKYLESNIEEVPLTFAL